MSLTGSGLVFPPPPRIPQEMSLSGSWLEVSRRRFSPLAKWMSVGTLLGWMWQRVLLCMSRNKLKKKTELFRNMLSACVFEKRFQKASGQHLLMILESFWDPCWINFDPGGTLGGSLGPPWDTFGPRPQKSTKNHQKKRVFRPHFGDLFSSSFPYFPLHF